MIRLIPQQVTPQLVSLFDLNSPAYLRCFATLEGKCPSTIFTDDPKLPTWGIVRENLDGTIYVGGSLDAEILRQAIADLRRDGDVLIGFWHGDPIVDLLPPDPEYVGEVLDFYDRAGVDLAALIEKIPPHLELRAMDREWFERTLWYQETLKAWGGSVERVLEETLAFYLVHDGQVIAEATSGPVVALNSGRIREMGVVTREGHWGNGYATLVSARLVQECEARGEQTYWNCAAQNLASAAVARKLGYQTEKKYRLFAWFQFK